jgi:ribosomal protein S18 acetylase RimI-like enzyme
MTTSVQEETIAPLATAFVDDPVIRWVYPEPGRYLECFPRLVEVLAAPSFERSTADLHPEGVAAAIWIEPEVEPDEEALVGLLSETVAATRVPDVLGLLERMDQHHPRTPTWYLPFIGVDPGRQKGGLGGELLARGSARADADGLPAYLEASSPRNRALYERHGFEVTGEIRVADSPPLWPMLRHPR